ncbi:cupin domain-containing protein [Candidatus Mycalebacterium sp.]
MKPANIIKKLGLKPLEREGGLYRQTYVSPETVASSHLPDRYKGDRNFSSAIYYFLQKNEVSVMHRLMSDEVYHFYSGDPVQLLTLKPGGPGLVFLGSDIMFGQYPQVVVPAGVWQGMKIVDGGEYALMGTTVSPAYTEDDFELGDPEKLCKQFSEHSGLIKTLSR